MSSSTSCSEMIESEASEPSGSGDAGAVLCMDVGALTTVDM